MFEIVLFLAILMLSKCSVDCVIPTKVECGYKVCPLTKDGSLNVHLIPHSHMDAGWVKTFDEYYYGTRTSISAANVQQIYHSVISELLHDKRRKFTLSESSYFWRWWKQQRAAVRSSFRSLVQEGRLELAGGGWVQNDAATTDYVQIIDQFTWGLRKINDTLGPCGRPKAAWQIDSYGHSREQASLLAQIGFDGLFIGRVDYKMREAMINEERLEFMWRGSDILGKMTDIMTHTLYNLYNAPEGFCFDFLCSDEPIVDNTESPLYNADKRIAEFVNHLEKQAKYYEHDNILVTMGGDFTYQNAASWYTNIDKLINYVNNHSNLSDINIFYSTPSCYLKSVYLFGRRDKALYTELGDLFPYGSDPNTYWSGFYTSRPSFKYFVRQAHSFLQIMKQISVLTRTSDFYELHLLRHATSLVQHHDAITGTSQQHVINDFTKILNEAVEACTKKLSGLLSYLTPGWGNSRRKNNLPFVVCHQLNISQCKFTETSDAFILLVYNPQSVKTYHYVRLPAVAINYSIKDPNDDEVESQLIPLPASIINLPGRASTAIQELVFEAENIPPMGYNAYYITPIKDMSDYNKETLPATTAVQEESIPYISNEFLKVTVDKNTGLLQSIQHVDGMSVRVSQNFLAYRYVQPTQNSGAYSFRPEDKARPITEHATFHTIRGMLVKEIRQRFSDWVSQTIRLYRGEEFVELEWVIGPVPIENDVGKEVISLFKTNISNHGVFYTDSNGRQMMPRNTWPENEKRPSIPSRYYPVTSRICIRENNVSTEFCVLPDRAQGATSAGDGELELMIHRRLLTDDGFGLDESLNEEANGVGLVVRGKHRIVLGNFRDGTSSTDPLTTDRSFEAAHAWKMEPWLFLTSGDKLNRRKWQNVKNKRFSPIRIHGLPRHINILTLEPWKANSVLLRLENTLDKSFAGYTGERSSINPEDPLIRNSHITVDLNKLFHHLKIERLRETTLAANQWLEDARQMDWSTRYVYNGGDDGILADDITTEESRKGVDSDEEKTYNRIRKQTRKRKKPKTKSSLSRRNKVQNYDKRRKRSPSNASEEVTHENIDNEIITNTDTTNTVSTTNTKPTTTEQASTSTATTQTIKTTTSKVRIKPKTFKHFSKEVLTNPNRLHRVLQKLPELKYTDKSEAHRTEASNEADYFQSDEDSVLDRSFKTKKPKAKLDPEDVTKSIYEMYYKTFPKKGNQTTNNSENISSDTDIENNSKIDIKTVTINNKPKQMKPKNNTAREKKRNKKKTKPANRNVDVSMNAALSDLESINNDHVVDFMHFHSVHHESADDDFRKGGKRRRHKKRKSDEDDGEEEEDEGDDGETDDDDDDKDRKEPEKRLPEEKKLQSRQKKSLRDDGNVTRTVGRKKRTVRRSEESRHQEQSTNESPEPNFIVSLRPTQIRTFVVWFENFSPPRSER